MAVDPESVRIWLENKRIAEPEVRDFMQAVEDMGREGRETLFTGLIRDRDSQGGRVSGRQAKMLDILVGWSALMGEKWKSQGDGSVWCFFNLDDFKNNSR